MTNETNMGYTYVEPKEKATELVSMFMEFKTVKLSDYSRIYSPTAKQFSLMVVDQIIKSRQDDQSFDDTKLDTVTHYIRPHPMFLRYWLKVKEYINEL